MTRPKILFVVLDQLRGDCVHGALAGAVATPNIDQLRAEGVTFANHFTVAVPCGPARASLLTGLYAMNHRSVRNGTPLNSRHTNLALEARRGGYEPLLFGYTDTSPDPRGRDPNDPEMKSYEGLMPGFQEIVQLRFESGSLDWVADLKAKGYAIPDEPDDLFRPVAPAGVPKPRITDPALYAADDSDTAFLTDEAIKALAVRQDRQWLAHVTYIRPHPPLVAPMPYSAMYDPDAVPPPRRTGGIEGQRGVHPFFEAHFWKPANRSLHAGFDGRTDRLSEADARALRAVYFGLATEVDHHIGRLIAYLKASGQYDETFIIVTADHGEMLGDHFVWGKESVYDPAFHVPLIIRDPARRHSAGTLVTALTESIDLTPTILERAGVAAPPALNGRSLIPFLDNGAAPEGWRDHIFAELDFGDPVRPTRYQRRLGLKLAEANVAIYREERFKLVHFNGGLPPLLFDLQRDPHEEEDLAGDPAYAAELARLRAAMLDHRMTHADRELARMKVTADGVVTAPAEA